MLVDQSDPVNKYWDHREKMHQKILSQIFLNRPKRAERKLWKIPVLVVQQLVEGRQLLDAFYATSLQRKIT